VRWAEGEVAGREGTMAGAAWRDEGEGTAARHDEGTVAAWSRGHDGVRE
jgi:hypothetical protein